MRTIVWYRSKDLRLNDHAPLEYALERGVALPLFVLEDNLFTPAAVARRAPHVQFLLQCLRELSEAFARRGCRLITLRGKATELVPELTARWGADRVVAQHSVEPAARRRDEHVGAALAGKLVLLGGETLLPPGVLLTQGRTPFSVFGQFERAFHRTWVPTSPGSAPERLPPIPADVAATPADSIPTLEQLALRPNPAHLAGGEERAQRRLSSFVETQLGGYAERRDLLGEEGTSRLSADLKFGTLSIRQVWTAAQQRLDGAPESSPLATGARTFLKELLWREFAHDVLWHRPDVLTRPFRTAFSAFPWADDERALSAWQAGQTGYPIVDAAARQLLAEGFVHNRARMIAASFLTKHLLVDYRLGERHYLENLTDGNLANNNLGWQWSAGCGCDAQPYFRVFNPTLQAERFDPEGHYVRRWVPELASLPAKFVHQPWTAPTSILRGAGLVLGRTYPAQLVEHGAARQRFLFHAESLKQKG